jgi:hypothetical protein
VEEKAGSSSKEGMEASKDRFDPALQVSVVGSQAGVGTDLNPAKVAAMKAAEFGNCFFFELTFHLFLTVCTGYVNIFDYKLQ